MENKKVLVLAVGFIICITLYLIYSSNNKSPNIIIILTDDLGFSDIGVYGGEIQTPNIDNLAKNGLQYLNFYNTGRCWPTRAALLSGHYPHKINRDIIVEKSILESKQTPFSSRPKWAELLPMYLNELEYKSFFSGKWHIDGKPTNNGFSKSYRLIYHDRHFDPMHHSEHGLPLPIIQDDQDYYSTTDITNHAINYINEHQNNYKSKPFFLYLAYTAPHFPLQAYDEDIKFYKDKYSDGWDKIRKDRYKRQNFLGLKFGDLPSIDRKQGAPYYDKDAYSLLGSSELELPLNWQELSIKQRKFQSKKMEIHAAMVHRIDLEIGKVINLLKKQNILDDTLVIFMSDNGASAEIMIRGDGHDPLNEPGSKGTYLSLGPGWSAVSNTPFRKHKTWVHEGGIATPMIISWKNNIKDIGTTRNQRGHVIDILPTILDIIGIDPIKVQERLGRPAFDGKSIKYSFKDKTNNKTNRSLWFHHDGHKALIKNNYKLVSERNNDWELYNIDTDRTETKNLANKKLWIIEDLIEEYDKIKNNILYIK